MVYGGVMEIVTVFFLRIGFQVSAQPPSKKPASLIGKETGERRTSNIE